MKTPKIEFKKANRGTVKGAHFQRYEMRYLWKSWRESQEDRLSDDRKKTIIKKWISENYSGDNVVTSLRRLYMSPTFRAELRSGLILFFTEYSVLPAAKSGLTTGGFKK